MNFKKLLSIIGVLSATVPMSMSAIACSNNPKDETDNQVINSINQETLKITAVDETTAETHELDIIDLLKDNDNGLAHAIKINANTAKQFDPKLFTLDIKNIYYDKDKSKQVKTTDMIKDGTTKSYFFEFSYNKIHNDKLVEVDLTLNVSDKKVVSEIKAKLEKGTDGAKFSVKNTLQDALNLLSTQVTELYSDAKLSFVNPADAKLHLAGGNNQLNIKIVYKTANNTTKKALITNVNKVNPDDSKIASDIKVKLEKGTDCHALGEKNYQQDALKFLQSLSGIKDVAVLTFVDSKDANKHLINGNQTKLNIKITVKTAEITSDKVLLTNVQKLSYQDIQNELIKNINADPIKLTVGTYQEQAQGEAAVHDELSKNVDKYFKPKLTGTYLEEFNKQYLGLYNRVYEQPYEGYWIKSDFFTKKATTTVYFYIGYNKEHQTASGGDYIKLSLTVQ